MRRESYLYEIPAFFLLFLLVERALFPAHPGFFRVEPHPYWLGILLFSLRYGLPAGIGSGAAAASLYLGGLWWSGDRYLFEDAEFYILPGLFVAGGAVMGAAIDRLLRKTRDLQGRLNDEQQGCLSLIQAMHLQKSANRIMEQQVVSQMSSLVTLYHGSRELGSLDREAIFEGIMDFFSQALKVNKSALYIRDADRWTLRSSHGWDPEDPYPKTLGMTEGVIGKAGSEKRVVSLRDWFGSDMEKAWDNRSKMDAVMAGPLCDQAGEAIGVFSVQETPLLRFNSTSLNLLTLLLDWANEALAKCQYFEELKSKVILDEVFGVYNHEYFVSRLGQEFSRSKIYALPLSLLLVSAKGLSALTPERQVNFLRALGRLLSDSCRKIDIVTKFDQAEIPFAVLMMTASANQAREMRDELLAACEKTGLSAQVPIRIGLGSYAPAMADEEALLGQAQADLP